MDTTSLAEILMPRATRRFGLWFATGIGLYWVAYVVLTNYWPLIVTVLSPRIAYGATLAGGWGLAGTALSAFLVFDLTALARLRGAPRWLWVAVSAPALWYVVSGVLATAFVALSRSGSQAPSTALLALLAAATPLVSVVLMTWLGCRYVGRSDEPMDGTAEERRPIMATVLLVIVVSALGGIFGSAAIGLGLLVPGIACLVACAFAGVPRSAWLAVATPAFAVLLTWATPLLWARVATSGNGFVFLGTEVLYALLTALSCWAGATTGDVVRQRLRSQPRETTT